MRIHIHWSRLNYRYSYKYDNDQFVQKLAGFIENDLVTHTYKNLHESYNNFYVDVVNGQIKFVDMETFGEKEKLYLKEIRNEKEKQEREAEKRRQQKAIWSPDL